MWVFFLSTKENLSQAQLEPRPGPGEYTEVERVRPSRPVSVFVSTVDRFKMRKKNEKPGPAPGTYNPVNPVLASTWTPTASRVLNSVEKAQSSMFSSTQLRFDDPTTRRHTLLASNVGPGIYSPQLPISPRGAASAFRSGGMRFGKVCVLFLFIELPIFFNSEFPLFTIKFEILAQEDPTPPPKDGAVGPGPGEYTADSWAQTTAMEKRSFNVTLGHGQGMRV